MRRIKILTVVFVLALAATVFAQAAVRSLNGELKEPGALGTFRSSGLSGRLANGWTSLAAFTAATTTPDVSHRTYTTFDDDAQARILTVDSRWNRVWIRALGSTNNATVAVDVYLMVGGTSDHFTRIATLTYTVGLQPTSVSGSEFSDAVVVTNSAGSPRTWRAISPGSDTGYAIAECDLCAGDVLGFVPVTLSASDGILEVTGF